ncbi:MAG: plastocyanin/azurin family copper-binding protein [Halobacteriales archaeon]
MRRRRFLRAVGTAAAGGATAAAGCGSGGDGGGGTATRGANTVGMVSGDQLYFDPIGLAVDTGETVTFRNESGRHSATAYRGEIASERRIPEDAEGWNSTTLNGQGATFEHTFEAEGTYDYFCIPHKSLGMVGRIVVGDPGGPAEGSMPPDGPVPESSRIVEAGAVPFSEFDG